jgi:ribosomal protein L22
MSEEIDETADAPEVESTSGGTASKPPEADTTSAAPVDETSAAPEAAEAVAEDETSEATEPVAEDDSEDEASSTEAAKPVRAPAATKPAEKPGKPAPRRSRSRREPGVEAPVVRAQAKYVRSSARKARLVCDNIRGKSVEEARAILAHTPRAVARDWSKLLESAVANAEHNHELVGEDLFVKAIQADEGPTIKRFRPRAMGRATKIRKRTAHLTILLTPKD